MYVVHLGNYMEELHFATFKEANEYRERVYKDEGLWLLVTKEGE